MVNPGPLTRVNNAGQYARITVAPMTPAEGARRGSAERPTLTHYTHARTHAVAALAPALLADPDEVFCAKAVAARAHVAVVKV